MYNMYYISCWIFLHMYKIIMGNVNKSGEICTGCFQLMLFIRSGNRLHF